MAIIHTATKYYRHGHKHITSVIPEFYARVVRPLTHKACQQSVDYVDARCTEDLGDHSINLLLKVSIDSNKFEVYFTIYTRADKLHVIGKTKYANDPKLKKWIKATIVKGELIESQLAFLLE